MPRFQMNRSAANWPRSILAAVFLTMLVALSAGPLHAEEAPPPGGMFGKNRSLLNIIHDGGYVMYPILSARLRW